MANQGKRWSPEQDEWLLARAKSRKTVSWIASQMERSLGSIQARLCLLATRIMDAGGTIDDATVATGVTEAAISDFIQRQGEKKEKSRVVEKEIEKDNDKDKEKDKEKENVQPLNVEQQSALDCVAAGVNVFLTGPAGTGKSFTIAHITKYAELAGKVCAVTAMTGSAALLLGGRTLHSYIGLGVGEKSVAEMVSYTRYRLKPLVTRVRELDILIIDEISMMSAALFTKTIAYINALRSGLKSLQYVLCGDFYQLPPVSGAYCFTSPDWVALRLNTVALKEQMRQNGDVVFQNMLQRFREGVCSMDDLGVLRGLAATTFDDGIMPTRLYSTNASVDRVNKAEFDKLLVAGYVTTTYKMQVKGDSKRWAESMGFPEEVELCEGAQVIVTRNMNDLGVVNGSRGQVVRCMPTEVIIRLTNGTLRAIPQTVVSACAIGGGGTGVGAGGNKKTKVVEPSVILMPLKLAYALSIHKSQGMTLDAVEIDIGAGIFEYGQAYVAISRAKSLASIRVTRVVTSSFKTHPEVLKMFKSA